MARVERPFEDIYAEAGRDLAAIPWAALEPHPALVAWLDAEPGGTTALVIGAGLGDDAEELARRGLAVTAFDVSPTAVARCRERFPGSAVDYRVEDLFALPAAWTGAFDVVVEIRTIQSLPPDTRTAAVAAIAGALAPRGRLFVHCLARTEDEPVGTRPWPVSPSELAGFGAAGLRETARQETRGGGGRSLTLVLARPVSGNALPRADTHNS